MTSEKRKVLLIIPSLSYGGAEIMVKNLALALVELGLMVKVVCFYRLDTGIEKRLLLEHIPIIYLHKKTGLDVKLILKLQRVFLREKPDVVHTHLNAWEYTVLAAKLAGISNMVYTCHYMAGVDERWFVKYLWRWAERFFKIKQVALNEPGRICIHKVYQIPLNRIEVIANGVSLNKGAVKNCYAFGKVIKIYQVARFARVKNHRELLYAFAGLLKEYPALELHLVGDGPLHEEIAALINSLKIQDKVILHGFTDNVLGLLREADIFVLPSLSEGMPMSLLEAMSLGLPIVAAAVGGIPQLVQNEEAALLVQPGQEFIAAGLSRLLQSESLREHLGRNAFRAAAAYSSWGMAKKYLAVYFNK